MPPTPADLILNNDTPVFRRYARVAENDFQDDNTFQIAVSSEFPVERRASKEYERLGIAKEGEKFWEVLSHDEGDADLSRFNGDNRAAFLDEHFDNRHIGFVHKGVRSKDRVTRAIVECDNATKLSKTRRKQIRTGSRPNVSLGYQHTRYLGSTTLEDGRRVHRFAWIGLEVSSVAVPADPTVGLGRGRTTEAHCYRCGAMFDRAELKKVDDALICPDCVDAEDPGEDEAERHTAQRLFRAKSKDGEIRISHSELRQKTIAALDNDKRFKFKRDNGDMVSDFYHHDNHQVSADATDFQAIVSSPAWRDGSKLYAVDFTYDGKGVTLGESTQVEPKTTLEAVERGLPFDAKKFHCTTPPPAPEVDLEKFVTGLNTDQIKNMRILLDPKAADGGTAVIDETQIRAKVKAELEPQLRKQFEDEQKPITEKLTTRNKEIHALADESVKLYGHRWGGKPGDVFVVGERIRKAEGEICSLSADHDSAECRRDFKRKLDDLLQGSREPKNQVDAANLPDSIASRCSLRAIYNAAARSKTETPCFIPKEGAEYEAHTEIHHRAKDYPDGVETLGKGLILPMNTSFDGSSLGMKRSRRDRITRDALAGDFGTAGAFVAPEFVFPYIELLRNKPALARAGMTILSGVMGGLVLPRQDAPTTAQSVAEGGALTQYDQALSQIKMNPHRAGTSQNYSRLALLQSTPDFEAMVLNDHMAVMALYIDEMGLNGQGAGDQPLGILNQIGINSVVFGGSAPAAYKNVIALETAIRVANIYEPVSFISSSTVRGVLRVTPATLTGSTVVSGASNAIWTDADDTDDGMVIGRPAVDSQQVPGNVLVALVGRHVVMAQWGGLAVVLDTITRADRDEYRLSINTYFDIALRHSQAVARSADSLAVLA